MSDKITSTTPSGIDLKHKLKIPALHSRLNQQAATPSVIELPNRIMLMPDCSGSMGSVVDDDIDGARSGKSKIDILKDAVDGFLNNCNWNDTAVGFRQFGLDKEGNGVDCDLINVSAILRIHSMSLQASGGTPMGAAMEKALEQPLTRGVIISDGDATDGSRSYEMAEQYQKAGIPVDCIHIGDSHYGEERLQRIAELTGGIYAKISDASKLVGALKYLTPVFRAMLTDGSAVMPGADEVRK